MGTKNIVSFKDRRQAGDKLGEFLQTLQLTRPVVVLGLPRGGVPVAAEVADRLGAPLDILSVRKIGAPGHEELACGAVASGGVIIWNDRVLRNLGLTPAALERAVYDAQEEIGKRERSIRTQSTPILPLKGHSVLIIDDGIATGATMRAAIRVAKSQKPIQVVVGLPVGPVDACSELEGEEGVKVVCVQPIPTGKFGSVGQWYDDFSQVETEECREILVRNRSGQDSHNGIH